MPQLGTEKRLKVETGMEMETENRELSSEVKLGVGIVF